MKSRLRGDLKEKNGILRRKVAVVQRKSFISFPLLASYTFSSFVPNQLPALMDFPLGHIHRITRRPFDAARIFQLRGKRIFQLSLAWQDKMKGKGSGRRPLVDFYEMSPQQLKRLLKNVSPLATVKHVSASHYKNTSLRFHKQGPVDSTYVDPYFQESYPFQFQGSASSIDTCIVTVNRWRVA